MKKIIKNFIGALFLISLAACSDVKDLLTFYINHQATLQISNSTGLGLPVEIPTPDITTNSTQEFQNNKTRADLVKDVKLTELKLTITNPADKTFNFLKSIHIYISTGANDEIELAYLENVPANVTSINLTTTQAKLDTYIKASSYKLRTKVVTKETLTQSVDLRMDLRFRVTADPL